MGEVNYAELMDVTWEALYSGAERRRSLSRTMDGDAGRLLGAALSGGFSQDVTRRRARIAPDLLAAMPVSFFAFYGGGAAALEAFLESEEWRSRMAERRVSFPAPRPAVTAFVTFALRTWVPHQLPWLQAVFAYEAQNVRVVPVPGGHARPGLPGLPEGAWVAEAPFDVPEVVRELRVRALEVPWSEAILLVKPRPVLLATLSIPEDGRLRRVHLRAGEVAALRWSWDPGAAVPEGALTDPSVVRAVQAGLLR